MTYLSRWQRWLYERLCSRFIAVSAATRDDLSAPARARCAVVYNGTRDISDRGGELPWVRHMRREGIVVVGCLASVVPFKGYHHLLRAIAQLNRRGWRERAAFLFVGDLEGGHPDYAAWVGDLQRELGVTNATFVGWTSDPFAVYRSCDLTVLPSVSREVLEMPGGAKVVEGNEGFPRTHLEAMCFGLPIVGTEIAGVREQVEDDVNGYVVPPSDPGALADALERLMSDSGLRERMGAAGRRRVLERFSTERYVEGVLGVYRDVLGQQS
jgi:glycosyltransferase involved in cell wall biosynthesis